MNNKNYSMDGLLPGLLFRTKPHIFLNKARCMSLISIKWLRHLLLLILLSMMVETNCFATDLNSLFKGKWGNDYGHLKINRCKEKTCSIQLWNHNGLCTCDLDSDSFTALSDNKAIFYFTGFNSKKTYPIELRLLSKQKMRLIVPGDSYLAAREFCGANASIGDDEFIRIFTTSFNCENAGTTIENAICQSAKLAKADIYLAKLYKRLKNNHFKDIVEQQRSWIKERDSCPDSPALDKCLLEKYHSRISFLQSQITQHIYYSEQADKI